MEYNGIIRGSRTLDVLMLFAILSSTYPLIMDLLPQFGLSSKWVALVNIIFTAILALLRFKTTTPVGAPPTATPPPTIPPA